jgi:hypothetical protein
LGAFVFAFLRKGELEIDCGCAAQIARQHVGKFADCAAGRVRGGRR